MNRILALFIACVFVIPFSTFPQKRNINSAAIIFKQYEKSGDEAKLIEAKDFIDQAANTESTANDPKMWNYRAQIYLKIALKKEKKEEADKTPSTSIDKDAIFKATESYFECLKTDKKGRILVRKWSNKEDMLSGLVQCGYKLFDLAIKEYDVGNYTRSIQLYEQIFDIFPYDEEDQLKRGNITKETVLYNSFFAARNMKDNSKSKEILQELISINFNNPIIYREMSSIYKSEDDIEKALEYLALGREMFEDDQSLITAEINLYIELGKTSELIDKLGEAIELDPDNELLYFNRGVIYDQEGNFTDAEKDYKKALELNPDAFGANYNLGALYFNSGVSDNNKANSSTNDNVYRKFKKKAESLFTEALPYLEKAYELNSEDKNTLLSLKQLYYMNGDYKSSERIKQELDNLQ